MIEVLHLIDTGRIGGPGKTIINSARFIDTRRFRVHIGTFTPPGRARSEFARAVAEAGIPALELPEVRRVDLSHPGRIRAYARQQRIDIVHAHGYRSDVLSWIATRGTRLALVTTHHGWIRNSRRQAWFGRLAARLSARFEGVEVVSRTLLDELPEVLRRSDRVEVVHNAIVLDDYRAAGQRESCRRELGLGNEGVLFGVVGRLSIEKGCLEMLEAMRLVRTRAPHARLAFIGEGPLAPELHAGIDRCGLGDTVCIVPHQRDVRPFYEAMDVLVCPSRTEGLSNVILEAMAFGRPVVATRVGGNPELVVHEGTGLLVAAGDSGALADAASRLARDQTERARLGEGGRARVRDEFSFETRMRKEEGFYERALARKRSPAPSRAQSG